ncbi:Zinc finger, C2H2 type [Popillia japonica]|uniref:Zinc finger, C2H2 type n=1 Tax=Popillia japonica TaxID=7064 RepID=A0AAW1KN53_POPJA
MQQQQLVSIESKNNIMDLVCRTCLKLNKDRYNMFNHSFNNKLISDLIMELTSVSVALGDKFPVNICNTCLVKLNSAYRFKAMVLLSNAKLHNFYKTKLSNTINVEKQESQPFIKEELLGNNEENISDLFNPLDLKNNYFKMEDLQAFDELTKSDSPIDTNEIKNELFQATEEENNDVKPTPSTIVTVKRKRRNTRLNSPRNVNEKQVELLDNPDYKRIMSMGLTKKEKQNLPVYCPDCNKTFTFRYFVGVHAHLHTGNLPFKCDKCDMRFPKRPILKQHLKVHIETKDFPCEICGKAFTTLNSLRIHKTMHTTAKPSRH